MMTHPILYLNQPKKTSQQATNNTTFSHKKHYQKGYFYLIM